MTISHWLNTLNTKWRNIYMTAEHKSSNWRLSLQIRRFTLRHGKPSSRSLERWLVSYSIVSLRHWSSFFPVIGWKAFGISLAWVERLRALFQFWSDDILHCHLERGKLKQPFLFFFLSNTSREVFNELNMISVSFDVIVSRLFNYLHHWMVAVGMFCLIHTAISIWE